MPNPVVAVAGSSVLGAAASNRAARTAASATENAANRAADAQERMFERQVELQEPWRQAGINALGRMGTGFTGQVDLTQDPGYAFRMSEGMKALERSAAARGGLLSGGTVKAAQRFGQDLASQEYQNAYNRALTQYNSTAALAGVGQTATNALSGAAGQMGSNLANLYSNAGQSAGASRASGYMGAANSLVGGLGQYLNYTQGQELLNRLAPTAGQATSIMYNAPGFSNTPAYLVPRP